MRKIKFNKDKCLLNHSKIQDIFSMFIIVKIQLRFTYFVRISRFKLNAFCGQVNTKNQIN